MAYWTAIKHGYLSGLGKRRRRSAAGHILRRDAGRKRRGTVTEGRPESAPETNYARFMHTASGNVITADFKLAGENTRRLNYDFAAGGNTYDTYANADRAKAELLAHIVKTDPKGENGPHYKEVLKSKILRAQKHYDSKTMMKIHHEYVIKHIKEHVENHNPISPAGAVRTPEENKPFFMYIGFRAPHTPYSHNLTDAEINEFLPYSIYGKPGEAIGKFDEYVGNIMMAIHEMQIQDNTMVLFTSDNGPDSSAFEFYNNFGHLRMGTMRGMKASGKQEIRIIDF